MVASARRQKAWKEIPEVTFGCLRKDGRLRAVALRVMMHPLFDRFILFLIVLNCISVAMVDPLSDGSWRSQVSAQAEIVFTILFTVEMAIKLVALGLWGSGTYLADGWNWVDGTVVLTGWLSLVPGVSGVSSIRTVRVLRPLRTLSSVHGMRVIVESMLTAIPSLANVFVLCAFVFVIFGIAAVQMWSGMLRGRCQFADTVGNSTVYEMPVEEVFCGLPCSEMPPGSCTPSFGTPCGAMERLVEDVATGDASWVPQPTVCAQHANPNFGVVNFDNVAAAFLNIFTSITLEGWTDIMYALNASWGVGTFTAIYFVLLIMLGSFFLLNLALAVIWEQYEAAERRSTEEAAAILARLDQAAAGFRHSLAGSMATSTGRAIAGTGMSGADGHLAQSQRQASFHSVTSNSGTPAVPGAAVANPHSMRFTDRGTPDGISSSRQQGASSASGQLLQVDATPAMKKFASGILLESIVMGVILLNTVALALDDASAGDSRRAWLKVANYVFTALFTMEMVLKMSVFGVRQYASSMFNVFDALVVVTSILEIVVELAAGASTSGLSALRGIRLFRVFKLAKTWKDFRRLLELIVASVVDVAYVTVVLLIVLFIFVLLGMQLFGGKLQDPSLFGDDLPRAHFDNLWWSFVTVFQVLTGENWNEVLYAAVHAAPGYAEVYFVALNLIGTFIILNLFLAILLGNFDMDPSDAEEDEQEEDEASKVASAGRSERDGSGKQGPPTSATSGDSGAPVQSVGPARQRRRTSVMVQPSTPKSHIEASDEEDDEERGGHSQRGSKQDASPTPSSARAPEPGQDRSSAGVASTGGSEASIQAASGALGPVAASLPRPPGTPPASRGGRGGLAASGPTARAPAGPLPPPHAPFAPPRLGQSKGALPPPGGDASGSLGLADSPPAAKTSTEDEEGAGRATSEPPLPPRIPKHKRAPRASMMMVIRTGSKPRVVANLVDQRGRPVAVRLMGNGEMSVRTPNANHRMGWDPANVTTMADTMSTVSDDEGHQHTRGSSGGGLLRVQPAGGLAGATGFNATRGPVDAGMDSAAVAPADGRHASMDVAAVGKMRMKLAPQRLLRKVRQRQAILRGRSLGLCGSKNPVRRFCADVMLNKWFDRVILAAIFVSSVFIALDEPRLAVCNSPEDRAALSDDELHNLCSLSDVLFYADTVITGIFCLEMAIKIVARGFVLGSTSYLRSYWNMLDFLIVIISIVSLAASGVGGSLKALRSLRTLRALRPIRVIAGHPGLRLVVNSIFGALPRVTNVALANLLFFFIFAIIGMQNFSGAMSACNDPDITGDAVACVGNFTLRGPLCSYLPTEEQEAACVDGDTGATFPRRWEPAQSNFDNVFSALLTVFEISTGEMWPNIMYNAIDAVGPGKAMQRDNNPAAALYFILIQLVCSFFLLEVFTGVIIDNFNDLKEQSEHGTALLTDEQRIWLENFRTVLATKPRRGMKPPTGRLAALRMAFFNISVSIAFEWTVMVVIVANAALMATRHYGQSEAWASTLEVGNLCFYALFVVEAAIKLIGLGPCQYFSTGWNRFDFALVALSPVGMVANVGQFASLLRIIRVARIARLVRVSYGLRQLLRTLVLALPQLLNIGGLLLLVYFIYACIGMNILGGIRHGEFLNSDANFDSFFGSLSTLFRSSTGESYNGIMHDCGIEPPYCVAGQNCGSTAAAAIFFISFFILSAFIMLNILVAVILDTYSSTMALGKEAADKSEEAGAAAGGTLTLTPDMVEEFETVWARYDPDADGYIDYDGLQHFVVELSPPLGLGLAQQEAAKESVMAKIRRARSGQRNLAKWAKPLTKSQKMKRARRTSVAVQRPVDAAGLAPALTRGAAELFSKLDVHAVRTADGRRQYEFHAVLQALVRHASSGEALQATLQQGHAAGHARGHNLKEAVAARIMQKGVRKPLSSGSPMAATLPGHVAEGLQTPGNIYQRG